MRALLWATAYLVSFVWGLYSRRVASQGQFVYHQLAPDFRGTVLYPLNHLAAVYPDIHGREAPKYAGREAVMSYRVPYLDAPWADTVNLSTLDPRLLVAARQRLGIASSQLLQRRLLPIPIEHLVATNGLEQLEILFGRMIGPTATQVRFGNQNADSPAVLVQQRL